MLLAKKAKDVADKAVLADALLDVTLSTTSASDASGNATVAYRTAARAVLDAVEVIVEARKAAVEAAGSARDAAKDDAKADVADVTKAIEDAEEDAADADAFITGDGSTEDRRTADIVIAPTETTINTIEDAVDDLRKASEPNVAWAEAVAAAAADAQTAAAKAEAAVHDDDLRIWITGDAGSDKVRPAYFILRDNDRDNEAITFTFTVDDKALSKLSKESPKVSVKVRAAVDAKPHGEALEFSFNNVRISPGDGADTNKEDAEGAAALAMDDEVAPRDTYYEVTGFGRIKIDGDKLFKDATITLDPKNVPLIAGEEDDDPRSWIALGAEGSPLMDQGITIVPGFIELTADDVPSIKSVVVTSPSPRDDGGANQEVSVEVTLTNPAPDDGLPVSISVEGSDKGRRDTDYTAQVENSRLLIPAGQTTGTAKILVTPLDPRR